VPASKLNSALVGSVSASTGRSGIRSAISTDSGRADAGLLGMALGCERALCNVARIAVDRRRRREAEAGRGAADPPAEGKARAMRAAGVRRAAVGRWPARLKVEIAWAARMHTAAIARIDNPAANLPSRNETAESTPGAVLPCSAAISSS
jgi:hypothetical protein